MRDVKILLILVTVFAILLSCSIPMNVSSPKHSISYKTITQKEVIRDTVYKDKEVNSELRSYLESVLKDYKNDNLKQSSNIDALKRFIDSLARENKNMFAKNSELAFTDIINQRRLLESKELLLIEREKRVALEKKNKGLALVEKTSDRYTSILLITGVMVNLLMTILLYFYKRKQIHQLKKLNLLHA